MPTRVEVLVGWLALFAVAVALLGCVALVVWWQRWRSRPSPTVRSAAHAEAARHAAALAARLGRAEQALGQARERAQLADQEQAEAWQELAAVQHAHDEAARVHLELVRQRAERVGGQDGQQVLTHAAFAAFRRGDLSGDQLLAVSRLATGWDAELERQERELARLRVARREAQVRYRAAASRSRTAVAECQVAEVAVRALVEEAAQAAEETAAADVTG